MRRIFILLFVCFAHSFWVDAKLNFNITTSEIDSIIIKSINPNATSCFGGLIYDRGHFDEIFDKFHHQPSIGDYAIRICLRDWSEISMFIILLDQSVPLDENEIKVWPNEIETKPDVDWSQPLNRNMTNDPIETRTKIIIYHNGEKLTAFMSNFYIDILNYRYRNTLLNQWLVFYTLRVLI